MTSMAPLDHHIVVGIDDSESSRRALRWAAQQADTAGFSLEVVMVWEWPLSEGRGMPLSLGYDPSTDVATALNQAINDVVRVHPGLVIRPKVVEGQLVPVLITASKGADLVVIGAGHHGLVGGIVGAPLSVQLLAKAQCQVVIVREDSDGPRNSAPRDRTSLVSNRSTTGTTV